MVRFQFLPHFPVDYLAHPIVSSLVLLLCQYLRTFHTTVNWMSLRVSSAPQDSSAVFWRVLILPLISNSSNPVPRPWCTVHQLLSVLHLHSCCFFLVIWQRPSISLSLRFLLFSLCCPLERENPSMTSSFFVYLWINTRSGSGLDYLFLSQIL